MHGIFSPDTVFTPQAGTWGLHGIIPVPDREADFVFFVSLGQQQGDHVFDEGISSDGVLSWQSQPRQGLGDERIRQLIAHDDTVSNIYLFLRNTTRGDYTFYGRLGYLTHDNSREKPVYFQWQLLDWDELSQSTDLTVHDSAQQTHEAPVRPTNSLTLQTPNMQPPSRQAGTDTPTFRARKAPDYAARDAKNRALGEAGELLVVEYEKNRLRAEGLDHLADQVVHTAKVEGDGAGYDVLSFGADGAKRYIEVKTTRGGPETDFFMSANELRFAELHLDSYSLYRLYNFDPDSNSADYFIHTGALDNGDFILKPINFRISLEQS